MSEKMVEFVQKQPGFVAYESVRDPSGCGITISYWESTEAISAWKAQTQHRMAQSLGREKWYQSYKVVICKIE